MNLLRSCLLAVFGWAGACHLAQAEPLFAEVTLNGAATGEIVQFDRDSHSLVASAADLRRIGLTLPAAPADGRIDLAATPGLSYRIDEPTQAIEIVAEAATLRPTAFAQSRAMFQPPDKAAWGAMLDYGVHLASEGDGGTNASGVADLRVFGPHGVLSHGFLIHQALAGDEGAVRRLDTSFIRDDVEGARRLTVGDFISASLPWTSSVRVGGISLTTDFSLRPDLVLQPLPRIRGEAGTPSTVELYVDGVRRFASRTAPGPFTVDMAPMMDGQGRVSVVVTDALGRQTVQNLPFYAASDLLAPRVSAYALQAGWLREGYASPYDEYADLFVAGVARRGLTDHMTLEGHATLAGDVRTAGVGVVAKAGEAALIAAAFNASNSPDGSGAKIHLSVRRQTAAYSVFATFEQSTPGFRERAWRFGETEDRQAAQIGAAFRTRNWGSVAASYNLMRTSRETFSVAGVNWSREFGPVSVYANALAARDRKQTTVVTVGLTAPLRRGRSFSAAATAAEGRTRLMSQVSSPPPAPYGWGWRAAAESGVAPDAPRRVEMEVRRTTYHGELGLGVSRQGSRTYAHGFGSGSLLMIGGRLHAAAQVGEGFALIETGEPNVGVTLENRPIGMTGDDGTLLAVQIPAGAASRVEIDAASVPLAREITTQALLIRPPRGAGVVVRMPIRRISAAIFQFVDRDLRPIPSGAQVLLNGQEAGRVGFDGEAYLVDVKPRDILIISHGSGECRLEAPHVPPRDDIPHIGPLVCALETPRDPFGAAARYANHSGGGELRGRDQSDDLPGLQRQRGPPDRLQQRLRGDEVHVQRSRLYRLWLQYRNPSRWFGRRGQPPHDPDRRFGNPEVRPLSGRDPPAAVGHRNQRVGRSLSSEPVRRLAADLCPRPHSGGTDIQIRNLHGRACGGGHLLTNASEGPFAEPPSYNQKENLSEGAAADSTLPDSRNSGAYQGILNEQVHKLSEISQGHSRSVNPFHASIVHQIGV